MEEEGFWQRIREDFPSLKNLRNGKPPIYFDNACMTLRPRKVIEAMNEYYERFPACGGGRIEEPGRHWFGDIVKEKVEGARKSIRNLINAKKSEEIVFVRNTTEAINLVAESFPFQEGDIVLTTDKEHNSNLCPWQNLAERGVIKHMVVPSNEDNTFDLKTFEKMMGAGNVKLVSMVHTSNLDGYTIPAEEMIKIAHDYDAYVLLDGAQSAPHKPIDVQKLDVDFFAFSMHKMCGPSGMGILYGKEELLYDTLGTFIIGGDTVTDTFYDRSIYKKSPEKFEAGLQNYAGMIGAGATAEYLLGIRMEKLGDREYELNKFLTERIRKDYSDLFEIIGPPDPKLRGSIITLLPTKPGIPGLVQRYLNEVSNIMIRTGAFCVHSWFNARGYPQEGIRVSLYLYNTREECETFLETLEQALKVYGYR